MTNKEYPDKQTTEHKYHTLVFWWKDSSGPSETRLHDKTYNQALVIAESFGFRRLRWFNPRTWGNGVLLFNYGTDHVY